MRKAISIVLLLLAMDAGAIGYEAMRQKIWSKLYPDGGWTLYCNERFSGGQKIWRRTAGMQLEHVYPASWMGRHLGCGSRHRCRKTSALFNRMESDPHNIWPSLTQYNQMRSNLRYGEIRGENWRFSGCDFEMHHGIVEPGIRARGPIARTMLYMQKTYGLPINKLLMHKWARQHPETEEERRRNALIPKFWRQ